MMASRMQPEQLTIKRMGEPSQWVPIAGVAGEFKSPDDSGPGYSRCNMRIINDVLIVIEIYEVISDCWQVEKQGHQGEQQAGRDRTPFFVKASHWPAYYSLNSDSKAKKWLIEKVKTVSSFLCFFGRFRAYPQPLAEGRQMGLIQGSQFVQ
jgi:hypothetical protein